MDAVIAIRRIADEFIPSRVAAEAAQEKQVAWKYWNR